jgi:hypothetical protein
MPAEKKHTSALPRHKTVNCITTSSNFSMKRGEDNTQSEKQAENKEEKKYR